MGAVRDILIGDTERYDYGSLCMPRLPCSKGVKESVPFYALNEKLPILLSAVMGLQHAFAMVGGLITVPFVVFKFSIDFGNTELQQYAISASLISCGICTIINVAKLPIPGAERFFGRPLYLGSGVLSVMGISFTFLPIFEIGIRLQKDNGVDPLEAYGNMLGTAMVCGLIEIFISILPGKIIKKIFPPVVSSVTVILLGVALTGTGMKYWGGGVVCADMIWKEHSQLDGLGVSPIPGSTCFNGEVALGYGSPQFIGLGFSVMIFLVFIEIFGSVFMKNCNVVIALLFGYMVAGLSDYEGAKYVDNSKIEAADPITFLWVHTFPIGFYAPAVVPMLIGYLVTTTETVGDLAATYQASNLEGTDENFDEIMQGGLLSDAICSILSILFTSMPNTTFSQNNGVIALTKCASRRAGYACGLWLIFMGVFSKVAGVITSIPDSVLGGMTIFLFANVLVSGIAIANNLDLGNSRRTRFIMALSLALGVGVSVWPFAFQDFRASNYTANFWRCADCSETMKGVRNGVSIFLSTGYCVGTITAMLLNLILPADPVTETKVVETEPVTTKNVEESAGDVEA